MKQGREEVDINMEGDSLIFLGKALSAKVWKNMNLIIVSVFVLSLQF